MVCSHRVPPSEHTAASPERFFSWASFFPGHAQLSFEDVGENLVCKMVVGGGRNTSQVGNTNSNVYNLVGFAGTFRHVFELPT